MINTIHCPVDTITYRKRIKILRQMLRHQEWDYKNNGPWQSDHPDAHAVRCTAILDLIAELKGRPSSHHVSYSTGREGFSHAVYRQKGAIRQYVKCLGAGLTYA